MATRKGIHISGTYVVHHKLYVFFHICTFYSKKMKFRTESYFTLLLKFNDHPTRCFIFGLRRIHLNGAVSSN